MDCSSEHDTLPDDTAPQSPSPCDSSSDGLELRRGLASAPG